MENFGFFFAFEKDSIDDFEKHIVTSISVRDNAINLDHELILFVYFYFNTFGMMMKTKQKVNR